MHDGYVATTVDDIIRETGVARRTFFRYFAGKEDIVLGNLEDHRVALVQEILSRPPGTTFLATICSAIVAVFRRQERFESTRGLALMRLIFETPELRAGLLESHEPWVEAVAEAAARCHGVDGVPRTALLAARVARGALDHAGRVWVVTDGRTRHIAAIEEAFEALDHLLGDR
jgi:AcrR family transcriptional regulator